MEIIAVDDDPILLHTIRMVLEDDFGEILTLEHPSLLENHLSIHPIKVIILDLNFTIGSSEGTEGLAWISKVNERWSHISIIVLTAHGFVDVAVRSLKQGAMDFVEKPFSNEKLIATVKSGMNLANSQHELKEAISQKNLLVSQLNQSAPHVLGASKPMQEIYDVVRHVAATQASILIVGEHGTGKEDMARLIHQQSNRVAAPFVHVDLGSLTESLFESTLFGHMKGSFTDANEDKPGLIEMANFGTLFLDGIGDLPMHQQSKLLSVLQHMQVTRIGEHIPRALDVRLMCATCQLVEELSSGVSFRQDLFFRINTVVVEMPPLRLRGDDIGDLITSFLNHFNGKYDKQQTISKDELNMLKTYHWPGNIRELKNTMERVVIMENVPQDLITANESTTKRKSENLYELEKVKIIEVIEKHAGNMSRTAQELGIGRNTLYRKIKKYDI